MWDDFVGGVVVVDLRSPFVCLGTLQRLDEIHLELHDADFHDVRDHASTREAYVASARLTGIKRNRKRVVIARGEVVAISAFEDVVDE